MVFLLLASHVCWVQRFYFKGSVQGIVSCYLPSAKRRNPPMIFLGLITGPKNNMMLHFCPHVSGCKSLCCYKKALASTKSTMKKKTPNLETWAWKNCPTARYPASRSSHSRSCEKNVKRRSTYMTPPHSAPPVRSNSWFCVIHEPPCISHL